MKQFKSQTRTLSSIDVANLCVYFLENDVNSPFGFHIEDPLRFSQQIKPYLRPMSSMTKEECNEFFLLSEDIIRCGERKYSCGLSIEAIDWLNANHFDYRGLIEKGLALVAPDRMYKEEEK